jgi:hypothetical protein
MSLNDRLLHWSDMSPTSRVPRRRWTAGFIAVAPFVAFATLLAACGGGGSSSKSAAATGSTTTTPAGRFNAAAMQPFVACMSQHGVTVPTFAPRTTPPPTDTNATDANGPRRRGGGAGFGGGAGLGAIINSTDPATVAAYNACKSTLPAGVLQGQNARQAFVSCMKDHGVTVTGNGFFGDGRGSTTTTTPQYAAAFSTCRALLPQRPNRGSTTTTVS